MTIALSSNPLLTLACALHIDRTLLDNLSVSDSTIQRMVEEVFDGYDDYYLDNQDKTLNEKKFVEIVEEVSDELFLLDNRLGTCLEIKVIKKLKMIAERAEQRERNSTTSCFYSLILLVEKIKNWFNGYGFLSDSQYFKSAERLFNVRCGLNLQEIYQEIEAMEEKSFEKHLLGKYIECQIVSKDYLGFLLSKLVEHGYVNTLNFLLKDASIATCSIDSSLVKAAEMGYESVIKCLIEHNYPLTHVDQILRTAAFKGHEGIVSLLLNNYSNFTESEIGWALITAIKEGKENVVSVILSGHTSLKSSYLELSLESAIENGHESIACLLLEHHFELSSEEFGICFLQSIVKNQKATCAKLMERNVPVNSIYYSLALKKACENGNRVLLEELLSKNSSISQDDLGLSVVAAAEKGHLTIIEYLLSGGKTINKFYKDLAIKKALENGHENIACLNF